MGGIELLELFLGVRVSEINAGHCAFGMARYAMQEEEENVSWSWGKSAEMTRCHTRGKARPVTFAGSGEAVSKDRDSSFFYLENVFF
jgi:hypothetical protein